MKEVLFLKKFTALFLFTIMVFLYFPQTLAVNNNDIFTMTKNVGEYLHKTVDKPYLGSIGGEWCVLSLSKSNLNIEKEYFSRYYNNLEKYVKEKNGILHEKKYTEYSRTIVALNALGVDAKNVGGYNLLTPLGDFEKTVFQGINGAIWALIALDMGNYEVPKNENAKIQATKEMYIDYILEKQNADGGWAISGEYSDVDITAMALTSLSKHKNNEKVNIAVINGLNYISKNQNEKGGFSSSETISQVIIALCELKIFIENELFVKNGFTLFDALSEFYVSGEGFKHLQDQNETNLMATEQGMCALVSLSNFYENKKSLYEKSENPIFENSENTLLRHPDVKEQEILYPLKTYSDIENNENKLSITELSKYGIINGKNDVEFDPDNTMTRAEFATVITRALGLTKSEKTTFSDVKETDWFYNYVNTAYFYGIIKGVTQNEFNPYGTITKEEACVMLERAGTLCGIKNDISTDEARNTLCVFSDYTDISDWAFVSLGYCVENKIISDEDLYINSKINVKRCEIAQMLYNLLIFAKLI